MTDFLQAAQFDSGPLSSVVKEIRTTLDLCAAALQAALTASDADARVTALRQAQAHLNQVDGALRMVDVDGVGKLTQAVDRALGRMRDASLVGSLDCSAANCAALVDGLQALTDYLDELVAGAAPQPVRLFPYYRVLQEMLGAERIHPSELLQVDPSVTLALPARTGPTAPDYATVRARFEKSLLPFLKSTDLQRQRSHALALQDTIALVEQAQLDEPARTFWLAMHIFAGLVAGGALASDLYVKQLFGLINLQMRRLAQGQGGLPEAMLRDALFFIAAAPAPDAAAQLLRHAFGLTGAVPADYVRRRYPRVDAVVLEASIGARLLALAGEIKSGLRQVEQGLDAFYLDATRRPALAQIDPVLHQVHGALASLDQDPAMQAVLHVQGAVRALAADQGEPDRQAAALDNIVQNVCALGFFIDMLAQNANTARSRFKFDQAEGMLRELPFEKARAGDTDADTDVDTVTAPTVDGAETIETELLAIFIAEARAVLATVDATLPALRAEPFSQPTLTLLRRAFHTLKGSGRMVGLSQFADAGAAIEQALDAWLAVPRASSDDVLALLDFATTDMAAWVEQLAAGGARGRGSAALVAAAAAVRDGGVFSLPGAVAPEQAGKPAPAPDAEAETIGMTLPDSSFNIAEPDTTAEPSAEPAPPPTLPSAPRSSAASTGGRILEFPVTAPRADLVDDNTRRFGDIAIALPLYNIYLAETDELMRVLTQDFGEWRHEPLRAATPAALMAAHTLAGTSATVGFTVLRAVAQALETALQAMVAPAPLLDDAQRDLLDAALGCARHMLQRFAVGELALAQPELVAQLIELRDQLAHRGAPAPRSGDSAEPAPPPGSLYGDDLDADLLPVFLEEAADLLPAIGNGLRQWQRHPGDTAPLQNLLRALHTVKGSARMAGAMRLGQHTHEIETQIENMAHAGTSTPAAFDELLANYDHALALLDQLQQPATGAAAADAATSVTGATTPARAALVRVRADILDRLVNQAGEVSITRSKLESEMGTLKFALSDFSDNLARLKRQLREVEMQAESQIASRLAMPGDRAFDPLEFDRFTRLQELTRMMAESVGDVASFHGSLSRTVEAAGADLVLQARLTRELQRDLMRVRMVPFSSLSERLFRVARQSAKELDKRVNLDIRGSAVELDRGVLEQMAAPFEHLLRNAIVHGIESREQRVAFGKAETGALLIEVSQVGNEVIIEFSDDGAGLDLDKIRARARAVGLLGEGVEISDHDSAELIFTPGFSTADALTALAGRGVGMDVVRCEAQALGGTVAIASHPGKGARFTIHLPLTLAVAQVVLMTGAGKTYALPSTLVEQVLLLKEAPLAQAQADGTLQCQGEPVALHYLPALLGEPEARPPVQRSSPVMLLKSGAERMAVRVDEVIGNREVVIKNVGPQLSRMLGIAGASVLGSGEVVLILNPVALAQHQAQHPGAPPAGDLDAASAPAMRAPVIMVVDDSLTVRRVSQRMLEREGYQVMLAKDGVDALEQLQQRVPDLMLVDIEMPRMDGFDLTRQLRGSANTRTLPVIMVTSRSADKHRNVALELGVNAYFGKPFQEDVLLAAIAGLLGRATPA